MKHDMNMHADNTKPGEKRVSATVRFSQKEFSRGVDDALTLAPLRHAVQNFKLRHFAKKVTPAKDAGKSVEVRTGGEGRAGDTSAKK